MTLTRRDMLKGVSLGASGMLLAPVMQQLQAFANGNSTLPKRFVFVLEGNGLNPDQVQPVGIERNKRQHERDQLVDVSLKDHKMATALEPLEAFKDRTTIVQGLSGRVCGGGHSNNYGALGVYSSKAGPASETIDAALAKALPGVFPHIGLGMVEKPEHSIVYNVSAWEAGKAMPTQCRPDLAYHSLFGSVADGSARKAFQAQKNLLDFMIDDIKRVEANLSGAEREKLQSYLQAYESLRDRQSRLNEIESTLREKGPVVGDKYKSAVETDRLDAQFDLGAASLICGLTNVLTLASGSGDPYFGVKFTGLGIDLGKHGIGHGGSFQGKTASELSTTIRRFHMELIARLAKKLDSVPEGDGSMLDNTLIVYLSDAAEGHHSRCWEWPFVMVGNVGSKLKTGRYLEYPYYGLKGHRTIANLYTTFLHLAGKPRDEFGLSDPNLKGFDQKGPLSELLV